MDSGDFGTGFRDFRALNPRLRAGFEIRGWLPGLRCGILRFVGWNPRLGDEFRDLVSGLDSGISALNSGINWIPGFHVETKF